MAKFYLAAVVSLVFWYLFSQIIPSLGSFINISGAIIGPTSTIIIPVFFYHAAYGKNISWPLWLFNVSVSLISFVMGGISFVATIIDESSD